MELKTKASAAVSGVANFVAAYPMTSLVCLVGLGVAVVSYASTPAGAIAAAKSGATLIGGMALTGMVTRGMSQFGEEIDKLLVNTFAKVQQSVAASVAAAEVATSRTANAS
jgi:hypothetical protein